MLMSKIFIVLLMRIFFIATNIKPFILAFSNKSTFSSGPLPIPEHIDFPVPDITPIHGIIAFIL